eukprot:m.89873 g.89873  ORF g.89873 m.89873 type:complete len:335 (+) comp15239_c0_seq4:72-1076(+)
MPHAGPDASQRPARAIKGVSILGFMFQREHLMLILWGGFLILNLVSIILMGVEWNYFCWHISYLELGLLLGLAVLALTFNHASSMSLSDATKKSRPLLLGYTAILFAFVIIHAVNVNKSLKSYDDCAPSRCVNVRSCSDTCGCSRKQVEAVGALAIIFQLASIAVTLSLYKFSGGVGTGFAQLEDEFEDDHAGVELHQQQVKRGTGSNTSVAGSRDEDVAEELFSQLRFENERPQSEQDMWTISAEERNRFEFTFKNLPHVGDRVPGSEIKLMMAKTGLPARSLTKILRLAEWDGESDINADKFALLMKLTIAAKANMPIPDELPASLRASLRS